MSKDFVKSTVVDLALLQLLVGLHHVVLSLLLELIQVLSFIHCCVHMGFEVCLRSQLKDISVEGRHLWLDVVEQIGLLHVRSLHLDWNLLKHLFHCEFLA